MFTLSLASLFTLLAAKLIQSALQCNHPTNPLLNYYLNGEAGHSSARTLLWGLIYMALLKKSVYSFEEEFNQKHLSFFIHTFILSYLGLKYVHDPLLINSYQYLKFDYICFILSTSAPSFLQCKTS